MKMRLSQAAIKEAEQGPLFESDALTGYSGKRLIGVLQRLAQQLVTSERCYLEVGVFQGLTLLSVAKTLSAGEAYGIDNFALNPGGNNLSIVQERIKRLGITNASVINADFEDALENLPRYIGDKKIGLYLVDGPHDYRSQLMALMLARPFLADECAILIDDANYAHVRQANRDFLQVCPEFRLLFEAYTPAHPKNLKGASEMGWWDGLNVIVRDSQGELQRRFPPVDTDKTLFENDHIVHGTQFPYDVPMALRLLRALKTFNVPKAIYFFFRLLFSKPGKRGAYPSMNTYSDGLQSDVSAFP